jgi:hypothetical protein
VLEIAPILWITLECELKSTMTRNWRRTFIIKITRDKGSCFFVAMNALENLRIWRIYSGSVTFAVDN